MCACPCALLTFFYPGETKSQFLRGYKNVDPEASREEINQAWAEERERQEKERERQFELENCAYNKQGNQVACFPVALRCLVLAVSFCASSFFCDA